MSFIMNFLIRAAERLAESGDRRVAKLDSKVQNLRDEIAAAKKG